ncbi:MAG: hypothetical protein JW822_08810 [Spirochaetales bacterium]|nr:hypothetical protein [Spirochaetales bacterium]
MKVCSILLVTISALLISCSTGAHNIAEMFQKARDRGDVPEMRRHFLSLLKSNVIRLGMTEEEVVAVLGWPSSCLDSFLPLS